MRKTRKPKAKKRKSQMRNNAFNGEKKTAKVKGEKTPKSNAK